MNVAVVVVFSSFLKAFSKSFSSQLICNFEFFSFSHNPDDK